MAVPYLGRKASLFRNLAPIIAGEAAVPLVGEALILATIAGAAGYVAYDYIDKEFWKKAFGLSTDPDTPVVIPLSKLKPTSPSKLVPSIADPLKKLSDTLDKNTKAYNKTVEALNKEALAREQASIDQNKILGDSYEMAPLLQNQIYFKDALDALADRILENSQTLASGIQLLDQHFSLINGSLLTIAKNVQVSTQANKFIAEKDDYGDGNFFYAFKPTGEFWSEADAAQIAYDMKTFGTVSNPNTLPSTFALSGEMSLIDSMEGTSSKADIRAAVEAYRKTHLSAPVRAMMGYVLVKANADTKEATKEATDYYKASTEALKENNPADALKTLVSAVAPIARWAEQAKVKEEFLTTPRDAVDINGEKVKTGVTPLEVAFAKDVALAKGEADTNSIGGELLDELKDIFDGDASNLLKIFSYFPVTASTSALGTTDDFEQKLSAWKGANV